MDSLVEKILDSIGSTLSDRLCDYALSEEKPLAVSHDVLSDLCSRERPTLQFMWGIEDQQTGYNQHIMMAIIIYKGDALVYIRRKPSFDSNIAIWNCCTTIALADPKLMEKLRPIFDEQQEYMLKFRDAAKADHNAFMYSPSNTTENIAANHVRLI